MNLNLLVITNLVYFAAFLESGLSARQSNMLIDPGKICHKIARSNSPSDNYIHSRTHHRNHRSRNRRKVQVMCTKEPEVIRQARIGSILATQECQYQFRFQRWNCTSTPKSVRKILSKDTRESAFIRAITAAGVAHAVTAACSTGQITNCPCDKYKGMSDQGQWEWGGCGDNVHVGYRKSKDILDQRPDRRKRHNSIRHSLRTHNNEAGRLAVKNNMRLVCKCHGLSGSCTVRSCWKKLPSLRRVGEHLKEQFDAAFKVIPGNDGKSVIPAVSSVREPTRNELIFLHNPMNFCLPDKKIGSLGTHGRLCNKSSLGVDGCDILCCGRGYFERKVLVTRNCRCKFHWCCDVKCDTCTSTQIVTTCL